MRSRLKAFWGSLDTWDRLAFGSLGLAYAVILVYALTDWPPLGDYWLIPITGFFVWWLVYILGSLRWLARTQREMNLRRAELDARRAEFEATTHERFPGGEPPSELDQLILERQQDPAFRDAYKDSVTDGNLMATLFFGDRWDAPVVDDATQVPTPVGQLCLAECGDEIADGDRGFLRFVTTGVVDGRAVGSIQPIHAECELLGIMGHQVDVCSCHGYGHDRAAARLVWERVGQLRGRDLGERHSASASPGDPR